LDNSTCPPTIVDLCAQLGVSDLQTFYHFTTMAAPQVLPPPMTAIKFMGLGLEIGGHTLWHTLKHEANIKRFKEAFSVIP
jgi:hypothetical protein